MKKVDGLGRIVIPIELREKYGFTEGTEIEFIDTEDGVTVKVSKPICKICHLSLSKNTTLPLCDECVAKILKDYGEQINKNV